jgi:hypothetical protein
MNDPSPANKPSAKQVYCFAHLMADLLGLTWPENRAQASRLIRSLEARRDALAGSPLG